MGGDAMTVLVKSKENGIEVKPYTEPLRVPPKFSQPLKVKPLVSQPIAAPNDPSFASDEVFLHRRISDVEAPVLKTRGFNPKNTNRPTTWKGRYKGYSVEVRFPPQYPALPFEWVWLELPPNFPNVVRNKNGEPILCIDRILDKAKWNPAIGVRGVLEMLDDHPYFRRR